MSVQAISWVLEFSQSEKSDRLVLISIANHCSKDGDSAWPSINTIAKESHLSERQVQYSIRNLESLGELRIKRETGRGNTHAYSLPLFQEWVQSLHPLVVRKGELSAPFSPEKGADFVRKGAKVAPEPSFNRPIEPSKEFTLTPTPLPFELPAWVPREAWDGFVQMRKKIGYPLTEYATKVAVRNLDKLREQGENLEEVLNQSILNCWRGLFTVKEHENGRNRESKAEERTRKNTEAARRFLERVGQVDVEIR